MNCHLCSVRTDTVCCLCANFVCFSCSECQNRQYTCNKCLTEYPFQLQGETLYIETPRFLKTKTVKFFPENERKDLLEEQISMLNTEEASMKKALSNKDLLIKNLEVSVNNTTNLNNSIDSEIKEKEERIGELNERLKKIRGGNSRLTTAGSNLKPVQKPEVKENTEPITTESCKCFIF